VEANSRPHYSAALILGGIFCIPFILYGMGLIKAPIFIGSLFLVFFFLFLLVRFEAGFLMIIIMRSSFDYFKNFSGPGGAVSDSGFNLAALVSVVLIIMGVFYVLFRKVDIFQYEETWPFLLFLGVAAVSVFYSSDLKTSLSDWLRLVSVFSVYLLVRILFVNSGQIKVVFTAFLLSSLIPIGVACVQFVTGKGLVLDGEQARIVGTFLHPNAFASYLLILLVFGVSQWFEKKKMVAPIFLKLLVLLIAVIFIFTFSRGAWLAFVISVLFLGSFRYRKLLVILPLVLILVIFAVPSTRARIDNLFNPGYTHGRSAWT
jgi:hypothetical protein